jgi:hypothetical protein
MFTTTGKLVYFSDYAVVMLDPEISRYYISLMPKAWYPQPQKYRTHVTVVRKGKETIKKPVYWGLHQNETITIEYAPGILMDSKYFFLRAYSERLKYIRVQLGLPPTRFGNDFHITVANKKHQIYEQRI